MAARSNCVYCGNKIEKRSREHIIQNAIGGLYESEDICCPVCNGILSKNVDLPFTTIFNPIISRINNFVKTHNKKSMPTYSGVALHDGEVYKVLIKRRKVVAAPELSKKKKCDVSKLEFKILSYDFNITNDSFKNGIAKIAFNFAVDKGIDPNILMDRIVIEKENDEIKSILFKYPVLPFFPLNIVDEYLELHSEMEPYHCLILFNDRKKLWCYIDLFNTFQYYVLLSNKWDDSQDIYETYAQLLQKLDRTVPKFHIYRPKHLLNYAMIYGVQPTMDIEELKKRIAEVIQKESLKKDLSEIIMPKIEDIVSVADFIKKIPQEELPHYTDCWSLYFDEDDRLRKTGFRQKTYGRNKVFVDSYPRLINELAINQEIEIREYTFAKFRRLNTFLLQIKNNDDITK